MFDLNWWAHCFVNSHLTNKASHSRYHMITKLLLEAKDEVSASLNLTFPIYKMEMIAVVHNFVTKNKGVNVHKMLRTVPGT